MFAALARRTSKKAKFGQEQSFDTSDFGSEPDVELA